MPTSPHIIASRHDCTAIAALHAAAKSAALGVLVPVTATMAEALATRDNLGLDSLLAAQGSQAWLWVCDAVPLLMGLMSLTFSLLVARQAQLTKRLEAQVARRTRALELGAQELAERSAHLYQLAKRYRAAERRSRRLINGSPLGIIAWDHKQRIRYWNPIFGKLAGCQPARIQRDGFAALFHSDDEDHVLALMHATMSGGATRRITARMTANHRSPRTVRINMIATSGDEDPDSSLVAMVEDITELARDQAENEAMTERLRNAEKLEAIGQLAGGIAHEINTPLQFVSDNTEFVASAFEGVVPALHAMRALVKTATAAGLQDDVVQHAATALRKARTRFICKQIPRALQQSLEGLEGVSGIIAAMKEMSYRDQSGDHREKQPTDLGHTIRNAVTVARSEWKHVAEISTEIPDTLKPVPAHRSEISQVMLNLIVNAAHAIAEKREASSKFEKGRIDVSVASDDQWVEIRVRDDGTGIREEIRSKLFDPFFTTKDVGKGTGQGLALARAAIVDGHHGTIDVESRVGRGTTFVVRLPMDGAAIAACKMPGNPGEPSVLEAA